jgi:hypothetical protein
VILPLRSSLRLLLRTLLDLSYSSVVLALMNITDLTPQQLRRATSIKEKLDGLNRELRRLFNGAVTNRATSNKKRTMSAVVRRKLPPRRGRDGQSSGEPNFAA